MGEVAFASDRAPGSCEESECVGVQGESGGTERF